MVLSRSDQRPSPWADDFETGVAPNPQGSAQSERVSILMPMRNAAPYVKRALQSLLREHSVSLEIIVVDDGSTDNSRAIVESLRDPRIVVVDGPCEGIAASFNKALESATGDIIMRCDADDFYPEGRIRRQVEWLRTHPEFGIICGSFSATDRRSWFRYELDCAGAAAKEITADLRHGRVETHFCTFAVRAEVAKQVPARRFFQTGSDIDMQLRLSEHCRIWYEPENAYVYRLIDSSITHSTKSLDRDFFERQARRFQMQRRRSGEDDLDKGHAPKRAVHAEAPGAAASQMQGILTAACWKEFESGHRSKAFTYAAEAVLTKPTTLAGWRNAAVLIAKTAISGRSHADQAVQSTPRMTIQR